MSITSANLFYAVCAGLMLVAAFVHAGSLSERGRAWHIRHIGQLESCDIRNSYVGLSVAALSGISLIRQLEVPPNFWHGTLPYLVVFATYATIIVVGPIALMRGMWQTPATSAS